MIEKGEAESWWALFCFMPFPRWPQRGIRFCGKLFPGTVSPEASGVPGILAIVAHEELVFPFQAGAGDATLLGT